jgi:hypothetical protein
MKINYLNVDVIAVPVLIYEDVSRCQPGTLPEKPICMDCFMPIFFLADGGVPEEATIFALLKLTLTEIELYLREGSSTLRMMAMLGRDTGWRSCGTRADKGFPLTLTCVNHDGVLRD